MVTKKGLQCSKTRILRPVKKSTLEKESCEKLSNRMNCYGDVIKKIKYGKIRLESIDIFSENYKEEPMAETFKNLYHILGTRNCPTIKKWQLIDELEQEFPNHKFKPNNRVIKIPQSFTPEEIQRLEEKIDDISANNYRVKHNKRLNQYYLSYKRKIPA